LKKGDFKTEICRYSRERGGRALLQAGGCRWRRKKVVLDQPAVKNAINVQELRLPGGYGTAAFSLPWAVKRTMPATLAGSIQSILVDFKNSEGGKQVLKSAIIDPALEKQGTGNYQAPIA